MTDQGIAAVRAASRLRGALEQAADALATPRLDTLLACEVAIEEALCDLPPLEGLDPAERTFVRGELDRARAAMLRCRRLGTSLGDFIRLTFEAQGRTPGYGRARIAFAVHQFNERM
jgi:hypothetical protein